MLQCGQPGRIVRAADQLAGDPVAPGQQLLQPPRIPLDFREGGFGLPLPVRRLLGHQQRQRIRQQMGLRGQIGRCKPIFALGRSASRPRDQLRQIAVPDARLRQQHQVQAVGHPDLGSVDQAEFARRGQFAACFAQRQVRAHRSGEGALVGDRQSGVTEHKRAFDQLFRMRGAAQEAEVGNAMQFGVGRLHRGQGRAQRVLNKYTVSGQPDRTERGTLRSEVRGPRGLPSPLGRGTGGRVLRYFFYLTYEGRRFSQDPGPIDDRRRHAACLGSVRMPAA